MIALVPFSLQLHSMLFLNDLDGDIFNNPESLEQITIGNNVPYIFRDNPLIFTLPLFLGFLIMIYYTPSLKSLGLSSFNGSKVLKFGKYILPEYSYSIPIDNIRIKIKRKLNLFNGLFL